MLVKEAVCPESHRKTENSSSMCSKAGEVAQWSGHLTFTLFTHTIYFSVCDITVKSEAFTAR